MHVYSPYGFYSVGSQKFIVFFTMLNCTNWSYSSWRF